MFNRRLTLGERQRKQALPLLIEEPIGRLALAIRIADDATSIRIFAQHVERGAQNERDAGVPDLAEKRSRGRSSGCRASSTRSYAQRLAQLEDPNAALPRDDTAHLVVTLSLALTASVVRGPMPASERGRRARRRHRQAIPCADSETRDGAHHPKRAGTLDFRVSSLLKSLNTRHRGLLR